MGIPYAEVIGDPIVHSRSPLIHQFWLEKLGLDGDFRAVRVHHNDLPEYIAKRRQDSDWRGCSATLPHKLHVIDLVDTFTAEAVAVGAVNCVYRSENRLVGTNTDVDGVNKVFDSRLWRANRATVVGGGGAARSVLEALRQRDTLEVFMIVREPEEARSLHAAFARSGSVHSFDDVHIALSGSEYVVNATPLGMAGMTEMPPSILAGLQEVADHAIVFDMVYDPVETQLLKRARERSLRVVPGLDMLVAQARSAFHRFFGVEPPVEYDGALMNRLTS